MSQAACPRCGVDAEESGWCACCGQDLHPERTGRFSRKAAERAVAYERNPAAAVSVFRASQGDDGPVTTAGRAPTSSAPVQPAGWFAGDATAEAADTKACPRCAETVKAAAKVCRFCGHDFEARAWGTRTAGAPWGSSAAAVQAPVATSGLAVGALVASCVGVSLLGIILGVMAQKEIDTSGGRLGGRGLATAAVWIGGVLLVVQGFTLLLILGTAGG